MVYQVWSSHNNLMLNTAKTVETTVNFRKSPPALSALTILDRTVVAVESCKFLGTTITRDLKWDSNISSIIKRALQRMCFLRQLRKFNLPQELMVWFCTAIIESIITTSITVWGSSATKHDLHRLQRIIRSAERTTGVKLPTLLELHASRTRKRAEKISTDPSHAGHHLFQLHPSGRRFSQMRIRTSRLQRSFFPQAITLLNS
ncbi:uncharacterized protein LOC119263444 [Pygocentrus nattereri]|uniref:uncharacterized protein LOC119263444 n=1 Tax=Pygocentrus nattereri TaxID=42514 RepID=UPI001891080C|nr:uncharacterized protein LOC119263444 [Pygocentrus nattereri]XP_037394181.1 uncharacterized protein LOC119263444 [Pygocentrus nattereri]XP_037394182.1 uncharacterized protein LOC119263444 [Pygocentrus nattereri]